jgi:hypothetical protein
MKKTLEPTNDVAIRFTEEELAELGINPADRFSISLKDNGLMLKPCEKVELDLADFNRETLEMLVGRSCEEDRSVNEIIEEILKEAFSQEEFSAEELGEVELVDRARMK